MYVLDESALLAVLLNEKGADVVRPHLRLGEISIVNVAEVLAKTAEQGGEVDVTQRVLDSYQFRSGLSGKRMPGSPHCCDR